MKVYIAGPINGMVDGNKLAFQDRAAQLRAMGHEPVNPWDILPDHDGACTGDPVDHVNSHRYGCFMRADLQALMACEAISLLDGWDKSRGATVEQAVASILGMPVI